MNLRNTDIDHIIAARTSFSEQHVFASYARADKAIVEPLVRLIRATGPTVFMDIDSIPAGKRWRPIITESLDSADVFLVFWCQHAASSKAVREEWERALQLSTDTVPVLMDDTDVPPALKEYQWIDLRPFLKHPAYDRPWTSKGDSTEKTEIPVHEMNASAGAILLMVLAERHSNQQRVLVTRCLQRTFTNIQELWVTYQYVLKLRRSLDSVRKSYARLKSEHEANNHLLHHTVEVLGHCCEDLLSYFEQRQQRPKEYYKGDKGLYQFLKHRFQLYRACVGQEYEVAGSRFEFSLIPRFVEYVSSMAGISRPKDLHGTEFVDQIVHLDHVSRDIQTVLTAHIGEVLLKQIKHIKYRDNNPLTQNSSHLIDMCVELLKIAQVLRPEGVE